MAYLETSVRIGILIPEFPGQTHIFFWRELAELRKLGLEAEVVSTRKPPQDVVCHRWSEAAMEETLYLSPVGLGTLQRAAWRMGLSGPASWAKCLAALWRADGVGLRSVPRAIALAGLGAALAAEARRRGWSHLHAHSAADSALIAMFCWIFGGPPYSLTLHGDISHYGPAQNVKWENARFGITVNRVLQGAVLERAPAMDPQRLSVAPMGVDPERFRRQSQYVPPASEGEIRLVSCGRLHPGKAHGDVIRTVAELRRRGYLASLAVLGEGPDRSALEALRAELGLHGAVRILGAVAEDEVQRQLEQAHAFVLASLNEALGVATMEAMVMGVPVVVTDVGGVSELVRHGVDGLLVPAQNPLAIADAVEQLAHDSRLALRLSVAGRERIVGGFTSAESAKVLAKRLGVTVSKRSLEAAACAL